MWCYLVSKDFLPDYILFHLFWSIICPVFSNAEVVWFLLRMHSCIILEWNSQFHLKNCLSKWLFRLFIIYFLCQTIPIYRVLYFMPVCFHHDTDFVFHYFYPPALVESVHIPSDILHPFEAIPAVWRLKLVAKSLVMLFLRRLMRCFILPAIKSYNFLNIIWMHF